MEKFQITNLPKIWVSGSLGVDENGISALAIMKKLNPSLLPFKHLCVTMLKTFMHGHLCVVTFLH